MESEKGSAYVPTGNKDQKEELTDYEAIRLFENTGTFNLDIIIHAYAEKSYYPAEVFATGREITEGCQDIFHVKSIKIDRALFNKAQEGCFECARVYAKEKLAMLKRIDSSLYSRICSLAIPKEFHHLGASFLAERYMKNPDDYYMLINESDAKEKAFLYVAEHMEKIFERSMLHIYYAHHEDYTNNTWLTKKHKDIFSNPEKLRNIKSSPELQKVLGIAIKYPEEFPGSISFINKGKKSIGDVYDMDVAFRVGDHYHRIIGETEPIQEILLLGAVISNMFNIYQKSNKTVY